MSKSHDAARAPLPFLESEKYVKSDSKQREEDCNKRIAGNVVRHTRTHHVGRYDTVGVCSCRLEFVECQPFGIERFERLVHKAFHYSRSVFAHIVVLVLRNDTHLPLGFCTELFNFQTLLRSIALYRFIHEHTFERGESLLGSYRLVETDNERAASGEIDTVVHATCE